MAKCIENNVASQGKSVDEALDNLREALELYFEDSEMQTPFVQQTLVTTMEIAI